MAQEPNQSHVFREMLTDQPVTELTKPETNYHKFIHDIPDYAVIMLDADGQITDCNLGAESIYGFAPGQMIGLAYSTFYTEPDLQLGRPKLTLTQAADQGHSQEEGWHQTQSGNNIWVNVVTTALRDDDGELIGYGLVSSNITDRYQAEKKLRLAYQQLEETAKEVMKLNSEMRELHLRMTGREYLIRDLQNENKLLRLRLEIDCDYRQPDV